MKSPSHVARSSTTVLALLALGLTATVVEAQRPIAGFPRSDQSDVTGPAVTSGDQVSALFVEPGTVRSMTCSVAWGVGTASAQVRTQLAAGSFRADAAPIAATAQRSVLDLTTAAPGNRAVQAPVIAALTANNSPASQLAARRLVEELHGLITEVERMDPLKPGASVPTRLSNAVGAYNAFVDASSASYLANPSDALNGIRGILGELVTASLENESRAADPRVVDAAGRACAAPAPPVAIAPPVPSVPPVTERPIQMCALVDGEFRLVSGIYRVELGDTLTATGGDRRPLAEMYPSVYEVRTAPWVPRGESVAMGSVEYSPFGVARQVAPGELTRGGQWQGHDFYTLPNEGNNPTVVYFASGTDCEVQPYRAVTTIRVRG